MLGLRWRWLLLVPSSLALSAQLFLMTTDKYSLSAFTCLGLSWVELDILPDKLCQEPSLVFRVTDVIVIGATL